MKLRHLYRLVVLCSVLLLSNDQAAGHFMWLMTEPADAEVLAVHYFSESAHAQDYHMPERVAEAEVRLLTDGRPPRVLELQTIETDDRVARQGPIDMAEPAALVATCEYGIYGGALLTYYAKHLPGSGDQPFSDRGPIDELELEIVPRRDNGRVELTVLFEGRPKGGVEVEVVESNEASHSLTTDDAGRVHYKPSQAGLVGVRAGFTDPDVQGKLDGQPYVGISRYATLTYRIGSLDTANASDRDKPERQESTGSSRQLPKLPEAVASFGAAVNDGWLYVYSGHRGTAHDHSRENLSPRFQRLRLEGGERWMPLPMEQPLQGLAMAAHATGVYRVGGLDARNEADEAEDLHSTAAFARFDPASERWTLLADLPEPRSSHEAVVVGDKLYVAGGWTLSGEADGRWLDSVLVFDLKDSDGAWRQLATSPFTRRAAAVSHWRGKLVVLGGIDPEGAVSFRTDLLDLESLTWSEGPKLPGEGMDAFGVSAWNLNGQLYVSGLGGQLLRLNSDGQGWTEAATLDEPSFFHQLLPAGDDGLIAVGGASHKGHLRRIERIALPGH